MAVVCAVVFPVSAFPGVIPDFPAAVPVPTVPLPPVIVFPSFDDDAPGDESDSLGLTALSPAICFVLSVRTSQPAFKKGLQMDSVTHFPQPYLPKNTLVH